MPTLSDVARHFKADGFEVYADVTLEGATGREHAPDLFCEREDGWLVVTMREELTGRDVVDAYAMAKDCDARAACHGARVTADARKWATRLGVTLVDVPVSVARTELALAVPVEEGAGVGDASPEPFPLAAPAPVPREPAVAEAAIPLPAPAPALDVVLATLAPEGGVLSPPARVPVDAVLAYATGVDFAAFAPPPPPPAPLVDADLAALAVEGAVLAPPPALRVDRVLARVPAVDFGAFTPLPVSSPEPTLADIGVPEPVVADAREEVLARTMERLQAALRTEMEELPWALPPQEDAAAEEGPLPWTIPGIPTGPPMRVPVPELTAEARAARERLWGTAEPSTASPWLASLARARDAAAARST